MTKPARWLSWGMDSRSRWEFYKNAATLKGKDDGSEISYIRLRNRIWAQLEPITNVTLYARLMTEPRLYFEPDSREGWANEEGIFDECYLQIKDLFGQPVRLKAGRQEMSFGDRWLIYDGTARDGTRSEYFDAARLTIDLKDAKTTVDLIGIAIAADTDEFLPVINDRNDPISEQNERAGVLYVSHEFSPAARLDGHYIYRHLTREMVTGDTGEMHIPGLRLSGALEHGWDYFAESAVEVGEKNGRDLLAWGGNSEIGRKLGGTWKHRIHAGYEYMSGDDPKTRQDEGWDPVWSRRARFSDLLLVTFAAEAKGRKGYFSNMQRPNVGWSASPTRIMDLSVCYSALFSNTNPNTALPMFSKEGCFRGHLLQTIVRFKFNQHVCALLWHEVFMPGDFYAADHRDTANFVRAELFMTF